MLGKQYEKGVDIKVLRRLMEESYNRSPGERQRRRLEEEQRKKQELEEAEEKKRELSQIGFRQKSAKLKTQKSKDFH
ncbi:unnamed protein product [Effrenium voratum]|uniref:Uncharacterized protein n=1 Tax=Effrenium voratum TaxID=2562239 RepID=A0AA36ILA7_9DINO|nr:unnamed protein product [Effrenium voratum]